MPCEHELVRPVCLNRVIDAEHRFKVRIRQYARFSLASGSEDLPPTPAEGYMVGLYRLLM
jgi:hypothetical protein